MRDVQRTVAAVAVFWLCVAAGASAQPAPAATVDRVAAVKALAPRIEQNLRENVVPFWFPRCVDTVNGGYTVHYGPKGEVLGGGVKMIVTQSRQLWLASALLRSRYAIPGLRDAADHGYRFLRDVMWDKANGGFYWQVDVTGKQVMRGQKHLYGQAFAIYAVAEYAMATGNKEALAFALDAFRLIDAKAHDGIHGGYREYFAADWSAAPAGDMPPLGAPADLKLMNTHLHLLEAWATLLRASADPLVRERLIELVNIETHAVVRVGWTAHTDRHRADWTPILDPAAARVSYGHDLENIWLVADALDALNQPIAPYTGFFSSVFAYSRQHGWDDAKGGFYDSGPQGPAGRSPAEGVVGAGRGDRGGARNVPPDEGCRLPRRLREDVALHRHRADRLDQRRVVRVDRAGRHAQSRQQGHALEGRISQRPRAPAGPRSARAAR